MSSTYTGKECIKVSNQFDLAFTVPTHIANKLKIKLILHDLRVLFTYTLIIVTQTYTVYQAIVIYLNFYIQFLVTM